MRNKIGSIYKTYNRGIVIINKKRIIQFAYPTVEEIINTSDYANDKMQNRNFFKRAAKLNSDYHPPTGSKLLITVNFE